MLKFWLVAILFICSTHPAFAVSVTITDSPTTIGDEEFNVTVSVDGASNGTNYLRVDLYQDGSTNYFGETDNTAYWYSGSDGKQYAKVEIASGSATTTIRGKIGEPTLTAYPGPGNYKLRVRRYTSSGNQASNDSQTPMNIAITKTWPSPSPSPTTTPTPSPTSTPTATSTPTPTPTPKPSLKPSPSPLPSPAGEVAGTSAAEIDLSAFGVSPSPSPSSGEESPKLALNKSRARTALLVGTGLILISVAGFFGYREYLRRQSLTDL